MNLIPVIYENNEIVIVNKPAGAAVQGGEKIAHPLDEELPKQLGYKIYLVHRLDRDTAGLLIVAKTPAAAAKWIKLIGEKQVHKEYCAVCIGTPRNGKKGTITASVEQNGVEKNAVTYYEVTAAVQIPVTDSDETKKSYTLSMLHLTLGTGRMHQLRIHLAKAGCPIAGDDQHGDFRVNKLLRRAAGIKQLMLAAVKLTIPLDGKLQTFEIPLPAHMQNIFDTYFA